MLVVIVAGVRWSLLVLLLVICGVVIVVARCGWSFDVCSRRCLLFVDCCAVIVVRRLLTVVCCTLMLFVDVIRCLLFVGVRC